MPKRKALAMLVAVMFIAAFFAMPALAMAERPAADEPDNAQTMSLHPPVCALLQDGQRFLAADRLPRRMLGRLVALPTAPVGLSPLSHHVCAVRSDPPAPLVRHFCTPLGALAPPAR